MGQFGIGDHVAVIYSGKDELWQKVMPYISSGLANHEKIVYVADENSKSVVKESMISRDRELCEAAFENGQIEILESQEVYYQNGEFESESMLGLIAKVEQAALAEGYRGVRGCGEMSWMLNDVPGSENLVEYEEKLSKWIERRNVGLMCIYNQAKFDPEMINLMKRIHANQV